MYTVFLPVYRQQYAHALSDILSGAYESEEGLV